MAQSRVNVTLVYKPLIKGLRFNENGEPARAARAIAALVFGLAFINSGCSAIDIVQRNATSVALPEVSATATTGADPVATAEAALAEARATAQALAAGATESAGVIIALARTPTAAATSRVPPARAADVTVYARIPIDSDRLNSISALALDSAGRLMVSTRAGEIYRLRDPDEEGALASPELIFADEHDQLGQVSGLLARGESLLLTNDGALTQLADSDGDGRYESVTRLTTALPPGQNPLQAGNSIVQAPDGRLFSADIGSGEILQIVLRS